MRKTGMILRSEKEALPMGIWLGESKPIENDHDLKKGSIS